ncbi:MULTISPECIES: hypothetical protein [Pantoea]|nr:hypothetical protein [Pantoea brenneri]
MNLAIAGGAIVGVCQLNNEPKRNPLIDLLIRIAKTLCEKGNPL